MRQQSGTRESSSKRLVKNIRRVTRKQYSSEEKIRIVLDGLRGEFSIAELCRREGIAQAFPRIPQMDCQFDDLLGRFCYKNQCNTIIATGQTRLTLRVTQESSLCGSISTAA